VENDVEGEALMLGERLILYAYLFFTSIKISREKRDEPCFMFMIHPSEEGGEGGSFHAQGSGKIYASSWQFLP
jgi:hypothetical protein